MILEFKDDGIQDATEDVIAHGTNTLGIMGAGAALALKRKFPKNYQNYVHFCKDAEPIPGDVLMVADSGKIILNMMIQDRVWGATPRVQYDALEKCLRHPDVQQFNVPGKSIAMTRIGAGLAGGKWSIIKPMINEFLNRCDVVIYDGKRK